MEQPYLPKLRRLALTIAVVLTTLVLAGVKLDVPVQVTPLGIPMTIERPDLITLGLVVVAIYTTLRYVYYGMLVQPSPMRARRELVTRTERSLVGGIHTLEAFRSKAQEDVDRYYPRVGKTKVSFETMQDATGSHVVNMRVPRIVRVLCVLEDLDFLLPILANVVAIGIWFASHFSA